MKRASRRCAVTWCGAVGSIVLGGIAPGLHARPEPPAAVVETRTGTGRTWSAAACLDVLENTPVRPASRPLRREAAARLLELYGPALLMASNHALRLEDGGGRPVRLRLRRGAGPGGVEPSRFVALEPADRVPRGGLPRFAPAAGEGVPLVATLRPVSPVNVPGPVPTRPVAGLAWAVTAVPVLRPPTAGARRTPTLSFDLYDPHGVGRVTGNAGRSLPLAADYRTPLAVIYRHFGPQRRGLRGFLGSGGGDFSSTGLYASQLPATDKTPLVFVHGLISDPTDFYRLHNALEADPAVRRRYQVWVFYYPTSLPIPYSAMLLREDLEAFIRQLDPAGTHPALHRAVLVGHSMGGVLCRLVVADGGGVYYRHFFRRPLAELSLTGPQRTLVRRGFFYRASPDVHRVIFVATPHQGSQLAGGFLGNLGRLLVRVPRVVRTRIGAIVSRNRAAMAAGAPLKPSSSLDSLSPHDPLIAAVADMPLRPGVGQHSILGDRGRGGPPERSSDGVVPYPSSHLPRAESEFIVPAGHTGTLKRPETAREIIRILTRTPSKPPQTYDQTRDERS